MAGLAGLAIFMSGAGVARAADGPSGTWRVEKGDALVRIVDCGGQYWGVVAWEKTPGTDRKNPNAALRSRPTLGMPVLLGMRPDQGQWSGRIYNAEDGQTYASHIKLNGADRLRVEGCVLGIMCGGETWTRTGAAAPAVAENHRPARPYTTGAGHARQSVAEEPAARVCSGVGRQ